jgi:hypothetical protein
MKHIHTYESFINEGMYQKYSDYKGKGMKFGSPDDMKKDVILSVKHAIPMNWDEAEKFIKKVEDQSDDEKGIKFEISLKSGDTIHGYKTGPWSMQWEWYLNKKRSSKGEIRDYLENKIYKPYELWQRHYDGRDKFYMYADDNRAYQSGAAHEKFIKTLYDKLSSSDKKKADKHMEMNETNEPAYSTTDLKPGDVVKVDGAAVTVSKVTEVAGDNVISFDGECDGQQCTVSYDDGQDGYAFLDKESGRFMSYAEVKNMR